MPEPHAAKCAIITCVVKSVPSSLLPKSLVLKKTLDPFPLSGGPFAWVQLNCSTTGG